MADQALPEPPGIAVKAAPTASPERWLGPIIFMVSVWVGSRVFLTRGCLCLDDAYIYLSAARNLISGHGPTINPGDHHSGATSALWVSIVGLMLDLSAQAKVLEEQLRIISAALLTIGSYAVARMLRPSLGPIAWLAPIAVFATPWLTVFVGMETALAICMASVISYLVARGTNRPILCGLCVGLGYLSRAELIFFAPMMLAAFVVRHRLFTLSRARQFVAR